MKSTTNAPSPTVPSPTELMRLAMPWQSWMIEQSRLWVQGQARGLSVLERFNDGWLRRRRAGADEALTMIDRMAATEDPAERAELCSRWLTSLTERMGEDFRSVNDCFDGLSREALAELRTETEEPPREKAGAHGGTRSAAAAAAKQVA